MRNSNFNWRRLRRRRTIAIATASAAVGAGAVVIPASIAAAAPSCSVTYTKQWDNGSGFGAGIVITNTGDPITGWSMSFNFPGNQQVDHGWPVAVAQQGSTVTFSSNAEWNESLPTGATFTVGFNGSYSGQNVDPTSFSLNGTVCNDTSGTPELVIEPTSVSVPEGGMATFSVRLSSAPSGDVTVTSTRTAGDTDITVSAGGTLTFTPQNFGT